VKILSIMLASAILALGYESVSVADHNTKEAIEKRTAPVGTLNIVSAVETNTISKSNSEQADGEMVYNTACLACHMTGAAGAPKLGDAEAWVDRIAQGMEVLVKHAIEGFQGKVGMMPPKGGNTALDDKAVTAAVQFMVDQSQK